MTHIDFCTLLKEYTETLFNFLFISITLSIDVLNSVMAFVHYVSASVKICLYTSFIVVIVIVEPVDVDTHYCKSDIFRCLPRHSLVSRTCHKAICSQVLFLGE